MRRSILWLSFALGACPAAADDPPVPTYTVDVRERRPVTAASSFVVDSKAFDMRVLDEPGDLLEVTPGLYVGQHAGGGKATQYLVRGFDADHGTDLAISVDDVPVNMRSHAHGQGYSDLNFVIPETIARVEITKGPYEAEDEDFVTAGSVNLVTREQVDESFVRFEGGSYDSQRYLALFSPDTGIFEGGDEAPARALFAIDAFGTDGPFANEEDLWQYKGLARMGFDLGERTRLESITQFYHGDWNASNEIPQRLVDGPGFDRWDAIDPSDGGWSTTTRTLLRLVHDLSESEFVFIGDAGTTEAKPSSRRQGVELSSELQILPWLFWRGDLAYSSGAFENGDKIPQAVRFIANTSLIAQHPSGVSAELDYLTLGERYGTESVSGERLRSFGVWNATLRYRRGPIEVAFQIENVFDADWESAEFFFPSRLPGEPVAGVDDLHFVPGNERNFRGWVSYYF